MNLSAVDVKKLLPRFIRDERTAKAICAAILPTINRLVGSIGAMQLFMVDTLPESMLDVMARQRNVLWYDYGASVEIKRALIKSAYEVHRTLGTRSAIEMVASDYFGDAKVEEWYEYGGTHHAFRVVTSSVEAEQNNGAKLRAAIELVKRCSAVLDGVYVGVEASGTMCAGGVASSHDLTSTYLTY